MILAPAVTIVCNGAIVAGVASARIAGGRVLAPLAPAIVGIASRVVYDPAAETVAVDANGVRVIVPVVIVENDVPYVAIGRVIERLGGRATYDVRRRTLVLELPPAGSIATPAPFDPKLQQVAPNQVFTPTPPRPATQPIPSSEPRPRRTAIPAAPSQPVPPPAEPTSPRRSRF